MIINKLLGLEKESIRRAIPIIGREKGEWLLKIIKKHKPKRILELGTATGYSGIILTSRGAELTTIDMSPKAVEEAKINFKKFNIKVNIILGNAVEEIKKLTSTYDLIFIDFALQQYINVLEDCLRLTKEGSVIIADNINLKVQKSTGEKSCQDFKQAILNNKSLKTKIIEIKDGLSYSIKVCNVP